MTGFVIGIDVQVARECPFAVLDMTTSRVVQTGWLSGDNLAEKVRALSATYEDATFAIDAPRMPLTSPRKWYWRNAKGWMCGSGSEKGLGRHCEVVIKAYSLANPQWTPLAEQAPDWMKLGFKIFETLEGRSLTLEVFPSATYRMLHHEGGTRVEIPLAGFLPGPKDMLDAIVAALTGAEFLAGRGQEVGGGDGFGTIVLPRKLSEEESSVLMWPGTPAFRIE